jgi:serine O-acetyltransferase
MRYAELRELINADAYRYTGNNRLTSRLAQFIISPGFCFSWWMRVCRYLHEHTVLRILLPLAWLVYHRLQVKFGYGISYRSEIGGGLSLPHYGGINVSELAHIGCNCNLSQLVTIGVSRRGEHAGVPVIGDAVYIGPGAVIFGAIKVGDRAAIGANCVVTKDVPADAVVVGISGAVISYEGSAGYIHNTLSSNVDN